MKADGHILNKLRKASLPKVPEHFFSNFSAELIHLIELEDQTEHFLEELSINRFENDLKSTKEIDLKSVKGVSENALLKSYKKGRTKQIILWIGAAAACLLLFFNWPGTAKSDDTLASHQLTEEAILAYLNEDDLVDYLVDIDADQIDENDLNDEALYEAIEDEIYNYINDI